MTTLTDGAWHIYSPQLTLTFTILQIPFCTYAYMQQVPFAIALILPFELTVATLGSEDSQEVFR